MENKKRSILRTAAFCLAVVCALTALSGCKSSDSEEETESKETRPTIAIPYGQMTIHDVLIKSGAGENLKWEDLLPYTHTEPDETTAVFEVLDEYGMEYQMTVKHTGDTVESAVIARGEYSVDIRTGSVTEFWRKVMLAEEQAAAQTTQAAETTAE